MPFFFLLLALLAGAAAVPAAQSAAPAAAQAPQDAAQPQPATPVQLSGAWTLNGAQSQFPREVGFSTTFLPQADPALAGPNGRRRDAKLPRARSESAEDAQRVRVLTDEVRTPYDRITLDVTPDQVTIKPDRAPARVLRPGRVDDAVSLGPVTAAATATWETVNRLVVSYKAQDGRTVRYTYELNPSPRQLVVTVEFIERTVGDRVRRVYDPAPADAPLATPTPGSPGRTTLDARGEGPAPGLREPPEPGRRPGAPGAPAGPAGQSALGGPGGRAGGPANAPSTAPGNTGAPAGGFPASLLAALDQRQDAPLRGLTRFGLVVEELGANAVKCGLSQAAIETAVMKPLTDAGLRVQKNADEDTYLYVRVDSVIATGNLCVTRFDVTIYAQGPAVLTHNTSPVVVDAELLHKGGLAGGSAAANAEGTMKGILDAVGEFVGKIAAANSRR